MEVQGLSGLVFNLQIFTCSFLNKEYSLLGVLLKPRTSCLSHTHGLMWIKEKRDQTLQHFNAEVKIVSCGNKTMVTHLEIMTPWPEFHIFERYWVWGFYRRILLPSFEKQWWYVANSPAHLRLKWLLLVINSFTYHTSVHIQLPE